MALVGSIAAIVAGILLGMFSLWSRRGASQRARWWTGNNNGLQELFALLFLPGLALGAICVGLIGLANMIGAVWLVVGSITVMMVAVVTTRIALDGSRGLRPWVIPQWARVQGRTRSWQNRPTEAPLDPVAAARPVRVPPSNDEWNQLAKRLSATLDELEQPKVGRRSITLHVRGGKQVKVILSSGSLTAQLPGLPFEADDKEIAALNSRLRLEGWHPIDDTTWQLNGMVNSPYQLARGTTRALRLHDPTISPAQIGYTAEYDQLFMQTPMELPGLGQPKAPPMVRDSYRADSQLELEVDVEPDS